MNSACHFMYLGLAFVMSIASALASVFPAERPTAIHRRLLHMCVGLGVGLIVMLFGYGIGQHLEWPIPVTGGLLGLAWSGLRVNHRIAIVLAGLAMCTAYLLWALGALS